MTPGIEPPAGLENVAVALWGQHQGRRAAAELRSAGVRVLLLKGPDLQVRLYGTPARYPSGDVDVLVPRSQGRLARLALIENGWRFDPSNGALWRLSRAATFEREGFFLDLHWGLHAAHLPGVAFRRLERALWEGARDGVGEWFEPDDVSLAVYLGVHAAGHAFERPEWTENARAAAESVGAPAKVRAVARSVGVESAVRAALGEPKTGARVRILDGVWGGVDLPPELARPRSLPACRRPSSCARCRRPAARRLRFHRSSCITCAVPGVEPGRTQRVCSRRPEARPPSWKRSVVLLRCRTGYRS